MDSFAGAVVIFVVVGVVTLATTVMVIQGHLHWRGRDPWGEG